MITDGIRFVQVLRISNDDVAWQWFCWRNDVAEVHIRILLHNWIDVIHNIVVSLEVRLPAVDVIGVKESLSLVRSHRYWLVLIQNHINSDILIKLGHFPTLVHGRLQIHVRISTAIDEVHVVDGCCWLESDRDRRRSGDCLAPQAGVEGLIKLVDLSIIDVDRLEGNLSLQGIFLQFGIDPCV